MEKHKLANTEGQAVATPTLGVDGTLLPGRAAARRVAARASAGASAVADDLGRAGFRIAIGLAACIAVFAIAGVVHVFITPIPAFDLEGEVHLRGGISEAIVLPALFSGALLFAAAGLAFAAAAHSSRFPWMALTVFFVFMGADELLMIHERLGALADVRWQILYLPIALGGGLLWLSALKRIWMFRSERLLWLGGAACWVLAQPWEPMTGTIGFVGAGIEEILEMCGSALFLLALLLVASRLDGGQNPLRRHHTRA